MFTDTETQKPKRPLPGRYQRHTSVCIRCWRRRAQQGVFCFHCLSDMHQLAKLNGDDPHTCQNIDIDGNRCEALTTPGEPFCDSCEAFLTGQVAYG